KEIVGMGGQHNGKPGSSRPSSADHRTQSQRLRLPPGPRWRIAATARLYCLMSTISFMCDERFVLVAVESLLASRQRLSGVDNDRRLTRVMIVLCNRVHGAVGVGSFPVDALYSAVRSE